MQRHLQPLMLAPCLLAMAATAALAQQPRQDYVPPPQIYRPQQENVPQSYPQQRLDDLRQRQELEQQQPILPPVREIPRRGR